MVNNLQHRMNGQKLSAFCSNLRLDAEQLFIRNHFHLYWVRLEPGRKWATRLSYLAACGMCKSGRYSIRCSSVGIDFQQLE